MNGWLVETNERWFHCDHGATDNVAARAWLRVLVERHRHWSCRWARCSNSNGRERAFHLLQTSPSSLLRITLTCVARKNWSRGVLPDAGALAASPSWNQSKPKDYCLSSKLTIPLSMCQIFPQLIWCRTLQNGVSHNIACIGLWILSSGRILNWRKDFELSGRFRVVLISVLVRRAGYRQW